MIALLALAALLQTSAQCDSVIASARVDSVRTGVFVRAWRVDGPMTTEHATSLALNVGAAFIAPRPLKHSVFGAAPALRTLRSSRDTLPDLRAPNITGVYQVTVGRSDSVPRVRALRASLISGFDSAAIEAIRSAAMVREVFTPPDGDDSMRVNVRLGTDSVPGARRLVSANFPRMPVVDAVPVDDNPPIPFPPAALADSITVGTVVLRFIVGRDGVPEPGTAEVIRVTDMVFLAAALNALPAQRFRPATIKGCPVAQVVDFPVTFFAPAAPAFTP